jgi:hypothetical protein
MRAQWPSTAIWRRAAAQFWIGRISIAHLIWAAVIGAAFWNFVEAGVFGGGALNAPLVNSCEHGTSFRHRGAALSDLEALEYWHLHQIQEDRESDCGSECSGHDPRWQRRHSDTADG